MALFPLDFYLIFNANKQAIIAIDILKIRQLLRKLDSIINYYPTAINKVGGYWKDLKPINIT
ncbi:unnamed protein product [Fusarium graminearum]|nr:unnamed protein product [Fusarium graminearum]CAG1976481.1 unnamed protein product [Fusarium graminearum]